MKRARMIILGLALISLAAGRCWAIDTCSECVLGIWDDLALTRNHGEIVAGQPKTVYVGIKFAEGFNEAIGISLSIDAPNSVLIVGLDVPIPTFCDVIRTPPDTLHSGGCTFGWPTCLVGNQALLRLTLLTSTNIVNGLLQVKRRYPAIPPGATSPVFVQCDGPSYTATALRGGYYILNWDGDPHVQVDGATFSTIRQLYR